MDVKEIENDVKLLIEDFDNKLQRMYGNSHSSIIGFISTKWIKLGKDHFILDGAPQEGGRAADLILCKNKEPFVVIEVETLYETAPKKYEKHLIPKAKSKIESIKIYLKSERYKNYLKYGIFYQGYNRVDRPKIDELINHIKESKIPLVFIFATWEDGGDAKDMDEKLNLDLDKDRYYSKFCRIDYFITDKNGENIGPKCLWQKK